MKSELVWGDFTAAARIKGNRAETRWQRELWARLPVPTELICSCTEPLAQFSRNRSPVHSPATEQNTLDLLSTGRSILGTTSNLRKPVKNVPVLACVPVGYKLFDPNQTLCNVCIYLCVPGCWLQAEMTGIWHQTVCGCPALPSSSAAAAEGTLRSHSAEDGAL